MNYMLHWNKEIETVPPVFRRLAISALYFPIWCEIQADYISVLHLTVIKYYMEFLHPILRNVAFVREKLVFKILFWWIVINKDSWSTGTQRNDGKPRTKWRGTRVNIPLHLLYIKSNMLETYDSYVGGLELVQ